MRLLKCQTKSADQAFSLTANTRKSSSQSKKDISSRISRFCFTFYKALITEKKEARSRGCSNRFTSAIATFTKFVIVLAILSVSSPIEAAQIENFAEKIAKHESLVPFQTPFRITSSSMRNWRSIFDDTLRISLNPDFNKPKGRENFLYLKNKEDLIPAISEQFRRYAKRNPGITVEQAIRIFDQTGAIGKIKYLENNGYSRHQKLIELLEGENHGNQ